MSAHTQVHAIRETFRAAVRAGAVPRLGPYLQRADDAERGELCGQLLVEWLHTRSEDRAAAPWIDPFLGLSMWQYRGEVCRVLTTALFGRSCDLAGRLNVRSFGEYRATALIGYGGFGSVFLARHREDRTRLAAVKLAHPSSATAVGFLANEANALGRLSRVGGVPKLLEPFVRDPQRSFLIMSLAEGGQLDRWPRPDAPDYASFHVARQLLQRVSQVHSTGGFSHGDLSPANILVAARAHEPVVTLVDFGNANLGFQAGPLQLLTARYAAPELLEDPSARPSLATDIWSVGIVLHELLGHYPFGDAPPHESANDLAKRMRDGPINDVHPHVPTPLRSAIRLCLNGSADSRAKIRLADLLRLIPSEDEYLTHLRQIERTAGSAPAAPTLTRKAIMILAKHRLPLAAAGVTMAAAAIVVAQVHRGGTEPQKPTSTESTPEVQQPPAPTVESPTAQAVSATTQSADDEAEATKRAADLKMEADQTKDPALAIRKAKECLATVERWANDPASKDQWTWQERRRLLLDFLAVVYMTQNAYDDAEKQYGRLLDASPDAHSWRVHAFAGLGDIAYIRSGTLHGAKAQREIQLAKGRFQDAVASGEMARKLEPDCDLRDIMRHVSDMIDKLNADTP